MWFHGVLELTTAKCTLLIAPLPNEPSSMSLQGNSSAGCCAEPPVLGPAAGGPPHEGLGCPGHRHRGGAAAAR